MKNCCERCFRHPAVIGGVCGWKDCPCHTSPVENGEEEKALTQEELVKRIKELQATHGHA